MKGRLIFGSKLQVVLALSDWYNSKDYEKDCVYEWVCKVHSDERFVWEDIVKLFDGTANGPNTVGKDACIQKQYWRLDEFGEVRTEYLGVEPIVGVKLEYPVECNNNCHGNGVDEH